MWTVKWWKDVAERVLRTYAASLAGLLTIAGTGDVIGYAQFIETWPLILWGSGVTAAYTLLMAIATHGVTGNGPSFTSVYKPDKSDTGEGVTDDRTNGAA